MHSQETSDWALLTDLYELTMANGYWKLGMAERESVFYLTFRENPFRGRYSVACGLASLVELLDDFRFSPSDVEYLGSLTGSDGEALFRDGFLEYLGDLRLSCDIDAVEEGTVVFPHEPLLRVRGPLLQAQILESLLLNVVNFQTLIATKASRICRAAGTGKVLEFGLRRAQGVNGALSATRAAYVGGCAASSNVLAGKLYGIPVRGTHAHSWVMSFDDELAAFEAYASALPNNCIFLVDTYDTIQGVSNAIQVAAELSRRGHKMLGIRLDSGDMAVLSQQARKMLNDAQLHDAVIVASNDLDEHEILELKRRGACIDVWGVGTRLATAYDQPALGGVYKLSALKDSAGHWHHKVKLSEQPIKVSTPGILQTCRYTARHGQAGSRWIGDVIFDESGEIGRPFEAVLDDGRAFRPPADADARNLLVPIYRRGERAYTCPSIHESRAMAYGQLAMLTESLDGLPAGADYLVGLEKSLHEHKRALVQSQGRSGS